MTAISRLIVCGVMFLGVACSSSQAPTPQAQPGGPVTMRLVGDWLNFDFQGPQNSIQEQVVMAGYDRLVAYNESGQIVPYLAKSWKESATSITFSLHTDATCGDGAPLTASAIANSLKRLLDPATKSTIVARAFGPGPYTVTADDNAATLTLTVGTPWSGLSTGFAAAETSVVCPAGLAAPAALSSKMFGSGPFTLIDSVHNDSLTMQVRQDWKWGPGGTTAKTAGFPSKLVFKVVPNDSTAANLLLTGGLDLSVQTGTEVPRLAADQTVVRKTTQSLAVYPIFFNHLSGHVTATDAVRQAIMTVIDQKAWNQAANGGRGKVSPSFIPVGGDCFDSGTAKLLPTPSIQAAQTLLQSAGWSLSGGKLVKDGKPLQFDILAFTATGAGPDYLVSQLTQMAATPTLRIVDQSTFAVGLRAGTFDIAPTTTSAVTGNPSYLVAAVMGTFPPSGSNYGRTQNPAAEAAYRVALSSSGKTRCDNWATVQEELLKAHDFMPTGTQEVDWFASRSLHFLPYANWVEVYSLRH